MPIVTESGLVGKIVATSSAMPSGRSCCNKDIRVSAKVQRSRVDGIIRWNGGDVPRIAERARRTIDVQAGDVIITSEYSSIFPPGIRIGIVSCNAPDSRIALSRAWTSPRASISPGWKKCLSLPHVPDTSRVALEQRS